MGSIKLTYYSEFILGIIKNVFAFFIISRCWYCTISQNLPFWKTRIHLFSRVNAMVADDLATQGARASAVMALTHWSLGDLNGSLDEVIFKLILLIDKIGFPCEIALRWMLLYFTDDKSILIQVMAWWRQATSHYLSQCWPSFMLPYGVTRPQWVNIVIPEYSYLHNL